MYENELQQIRNALESMDGVSASIEDYASALEEALDEIEVRLNAAREDIERQQNS